MNPQRVSQGEEFQDFDYYQDPEELEEEADEQMGDSQQSGEHLESMQQEPTVVIDSSIEDNAVVHQQFLRMDEQAPQASSAGDGTSLLMLGANSSGGIIERPHGQHPKTQSLMALDNI